MNVEARSQNIENILKKGLFIIPDYQREYDWDNDEVDEFLNDINETPDSENYFIGHMVLEGDYNGTKFNVIDGQQRFTTITIILCAIRDRFFEINEKSLALGLNENYIFGKDRDHKEYVILQNNMPYPVLQSYVQSIPDDKDFKVKPIKSGEKKIVKIYDRVKKEVDILEIEDLKKLRDKVLNLEVIFVAVSDEVDAFTIFETLNATGKDLTPLDLIKNQIFKLYPKKIHLDEPSDSWKIILSNSEGRNLKFLNNFWSSRFKKISNKKIYKDFINNIVKKEVDIKDFIEKLKSDSELFRKIISPKQYDWKKNDEFKVYLSLYAIIDVFNVEVANSILLSLLREYENSNISLKYLNKALNTIERYHFINNAISSNRSSGLDTMYAKFSRDLLLAKDKNAKHIAIDKMIDKLEDKVPSKNEFEANFNDKLYYLRVETKQKKLVQYCLNKIEYKAQNHNVDLISMSLEHIYPEKPDAKWTKLKDEHLIKNIGNLVLLDSGLNSEVGNKEFKNKKDIIINKSTLISSKRIIEKKTEWGDNEILERRNSLIDILYKEIWE
jgi:uncharacterized protein with ParB-like and HNH nuclease domain